MLLDTHLWMCKEVSEIEDCTLSYRIEDADVRGNWKVTSYRNHQKFKVQEQAKWYFTQ